MLLLLLLQHRRWQCWLLLPFLLVISLSLAHDAHEKQLHNKDVLWSTMQHDHSIEAQPFQSLGNHRYRLKMPQLSDDERATSTESLNDPSRTISAVRATLPWRRRDDFTRPIAVRSVPFHEKLDFHIVNVSDKECDIVINPTPPSHNSKLLPTPWLQNAAFHWKGSRTYYLGDVAKFKNGSLAASRGKLPGWGAEKAIDGLVDFASAPSKLLCPTVCDGWNIACAEAPCGDEYLTIAVGTRTMVDGFALWATGDGLHDPKKMSLHAADNITGPWRTIASFAGAANTTTPQVFAFAATFAKYFRWVIHSRHSQFHSSHVKEIQLRAAVNSTPAGYLPNHATSQNDSVVVSSTGAESGSEAWKVADGKVAFRAVAPGHINQFVGEGWNAGGTDSKGANYLVFDLRKSMNIVGFAMYSVGDVTHDPNECHLQISNGFSKNKNWTTVGTFYGKAGFDGLQEFSGFRATSRFWRFYIASTHVPRYHQSMIKEVYFKPSVMPATTSNNAHAGHFTHFAALPTLSKPQEILVYYLPYQIGIWTQHNPAIYTKPSDASDSNAGWEEEDRWQRDVAAQLKLYPHTIPNVSKVSYEARGPNYGRFNAFTEMERVATATEVSAMLAQYPSQDVLTFVEPRELPIVMRDRVPMRWALSNVSDGVTPVKLGNVSRNEYFVFQIGLFAARASIKTVATRFSDLHGGLGGHIHKASLSSPNLGGVDSHGVPFNRTISVAQGNVGVLWVGINMSNQSILRDEKYVGSVQLTLTLNSSTREKYNLDTSVNYEIILRADQSVADRGDSQSEKMSRLRWLDSRLGQDGRPAKRFAPLQLNISRRTIRTWSTDITLGDNGLPSQLQRRYPDGVQAATVDLLEQPMVLRITDSSSVLDPAHKALQFEAHPDKVSWTSTGVLADGIRVSTSAHVEADGYGIFNVTVEAGNSSAKLKDIALELPLRKSAVPYFMGLSKPGGHRPRSWHWNWSVDHSSALSNNMLWIGDVDLGVRLKLRGGGAEWDIAEHKIYKISDIPRSWAGSIRENVSRTSHVAPYAVEHHNITLFNGGVNMTEISDQIVLVSAYSGPRSLEPHARMCFVFELQLTPTQPFHPARQLRQRYVQLQGMSLPTTKPGIQALVSSLFSKGIRTINVHQGADINRYINWPLDNSSIYPLTTFAREIHQRGGRIKIYYTTRELSTRVDILWPLRSLGNEIIDDWTTENLEQPGANGPGGMSWLQEHLHEGYVPCWDTYLGNGTYDTSICDNDAALGQDSMQTKHRWFNYYTEGLHALMASAPNIDGLYLDGIGYDRLTMKRVRKVMDDCDPDALIDFHGGNSFKDACRMLPNGSDSKMKYGSVNCSHPKTWMCEGGCASTALTNMQHFPYIDYTLFGEQFSYDTPVDYWLVELSNIPYGLMGEMLGSPHPANPWRGMIFGMVWRYGPAHGVNKSQIWALWDQFDIVNSEMLGYWNRSCPVSVVGGNGNNNCTDVYATAYVHHSQRALVSVASWASANVRCKLQVDWAALGFSAPLTMYAPPIDGFQNSTKMSVTRPFTTVPGRGWMWWLDSGAS